MRKSFTPDQKVFLSNSHLYLSLDKLRSRWFSLFIFRTVFPHGAIKIKNPKNDVTFKINGQILKPYVEYQPHEKKPK